MKARELRIGNFIKYRDKSSILEVVNIGNTGFEALNEQGLIYGSSDVSEYNGIPLNEEWVLKFGFKHDENKGYCSDESERRIFMSKGFHLSIEENGNIYLWIDADDNWYSRTDKKLNHVHQLQNMYFALTEQELILQNT